MHRGHNTTYFRGARRRVDDIKISRGGGGGGIFPLPPRPYEIFFGAARARLNFARPRRAIIHGVPLGSLRFSATSFPPPPPLAFLATFSRLHARLIGKDCVSLGWPRAPASRSIYHRDVRFSLFLRFGVAFSRSSYPPRLTFLPGNPQSREIKSNRGLHVSRRPFPLSLMFTRYSSIPG